MGSAKAASNLAKHGISFADAVSVLSDSEALTLDDPHPTEERYITIGTDLLGRVLVVVYTWRGETVRMISARRATRTEHRQYAGGETT